MFVNWATYGKHDIVIKIMIKSETSGRNSATSHFSNISKISIIIYLRMKEK